MYVLPSLSSDHLYFTGCVYLSWAVLLEHLQTESRESKIEKLGRLARNYDACSKLERILTDIQKAKNQVWC